MKAIDAIRDWWLTNARIRHGHPPGSPTVSGGGPSRSPGLALGLAATLLASSGLGFAASQWLAGGEGSPPAAAASVGEGSLYQYLEDNGFHLPE